MAEEARCRFGLDKVLFVPNGVPPHKKGYAITAPTHRYNMTLLATHANGAFGCSPIEITRNGPSYTVDTLTQLRQQHPDAELFYISGVDAVADILTWKRHEDVIQLATFIAATRPGFDVRSLKERLPAAYLSRILLLGSTAIGISSSDMRQRMAQGLPARYMTPDSVVEYIRKHNLYAGTAPPIRSNETTAILADTPYKSVPLLPGFLGRPDGG